MRRVEEENLTYVRFAVQATAERYLFAEIESQSEYLSSFMFLVDGQIQFAVVVAKVDLEINVRFFSFTRRSPGYRHALVAYIIRS